MENLSKLSKGIGDMLINLSSEYPALLDAVFLLAAVVGIMICASGVFDVIKMGKPEYQVKAASIFWKFIGGASLVDLAFFSKVWTGTVWATSDPMGISAYVATAGEGDYSKQAMMAAMGIIVIAGYVTLARAYIGISRLGSLSEESRSEMIGFIVSR